MEDYRRALVQDLAVVAKMHRAGVPLLAGTDCGIGYVLAGFSFHDELELLVKAGVPTHRALQIATLRPAEYLGRRAELGTIEKGKLADLVLLEADPLQDICNTRKIAEVVIRGHRLQRVDLDKMLVQVAAANKIRQLGGRVSQRWDYENQITTSVDLRKTDVGNDDLGILYPLKRVQTLTLSDTQIADRGRSHSFLLAQENGAVGNPSAGSALSL